MKNRNTFLIFSYNKRYFSNVKLMRPKKILTIIVLLQVFLVCIIYLSIGSQPVEKSTQSYRIKDKNDEWSFGSTIPKYYHKSRHVNKLCDYAKPIFNNSEAMKEIDYEWSIMKPRYDKCYSNNQTKNLHLAVTISDLDLTFYDDLLLKKQLKIKNFQNSQNLFVIKLDYEFLKLNLRFNTTPDCFAYRFDRITNDDRYRFQLGSLLKIEAKYNYELIVNEYGFYHIYCSINKTKIFNEIKFILPQNLELIKQERQKNIDMEAQLIEKFKYNSIVFNDPIQECESLPTYSTDSRMNVFVLGIDSLSYNHLKRMFPKTYDYLTNRLDHNVLFKHYHSMAENTFGNLIALFSGVFTEQNQDLNIKPEIDHYLGLDNTYFDTIPFLWKDYESLGYLSWLSEDYPMLGMFQYLRKGFRYKPSSVYMMPYWYKYEDICNDPPTCHNNKHSFNLQFENLNHFFKRLHSNEANKKQPYFIFNYMKFFTHDFFTFPPEYDTKLKEFIESLEEKSYLDNTLFILMSDHGARTTSYTFVSENGRTERSLPFLNVRLPKKLWNTQLEDNLIKNSQKLVTHLDTFKTLRHFYYINKKNSFLNSNECLAKFNKSVKEDQGLRGISLFENIPDDRSCSDALIPNVYCVCNQRAELNETEFTQDTGKTYESIRETSMHAINDITNKVRKKCEMFTYVKMLSAQKKILSSCFFYEFRYLVQPGDAIFAVYYRYVFLNIPVRERKLERYLKTVRLSKYGKQSSCMKDKNLMGYCYCKNNTLN